MSDIYRKLAKVLDTLPNGFPATESGIEIQLLKKVFTPEEAELFCDLRLTPESADEIAERTGRSSEGLEELLTTMWEKGQVVRTLAGGIRKFKMIPWVIGIYEFQVKRMDEEFARLSKEYNLHVGAPLFFGKPHVMQVIPIEEEVPRKHTPILYQQVSTIIERSRSHGVTQCICKKERGLLGKPCDRPQEVCMYFSEDEGAFEDHAWVRPISKEEAYGIIRMAEDAALVHMTTNVESGHWFVCNCCGCCCLILKTVRKFGAEFLNTSYYAVIDPEQCTACGICADERCQVAAIEEGDNTYRVIPEKCIGCGLCVSTCPSGAITLVRKEADQIVKPPQDEREWLEERGKERGVDFSAYK